MSKKKSNRHLRKLRKKADLWAQKLGKLMGVRAIFLSGSVAQGTADKSSDIDFFFIARKNQIWTARFFVFLWLKINREITRPQEHAEKICPNHFITEENLEIQEKDAYSAHLFSHNIPLYDPDHLFPRFAQTNQKWVQKFGESFEGKALQIKIEPLPERKSKEIFQKVLEKFLEKVQKEKIKRNPNFKNPQAKIILTERELRFHPKPKNKLFKKKK